MVKQLSQEEINNGQKVYTPMMLAIYNLYVLQFSNYFVWRCPRKKILAFYNQHISNNHLDVGVGTGYFLNHCQFPGEKTNLALLDLNPNCLHYTENLLQRYQPKIYQRDIYQPLNDISQRFNSIGLNYVLHCLPGSFAEKSQVIAHLKTLLNQDGILFGSTILAKDNKHNALGKYLLNLYNKKGFFGNLADSELELELMLKKHFADVEINIVGTVAFFVAKKPVSI